MKKTLVALAVMAVAGSANASIELYNKDGVTANLKGDIEVRYKKAIGKDTDFAQEIDDADFAFDLRYAVNDDLQVGGFFEVSDSATGQGDAYIGFYTTDAGQLVFGKTATMLDEAGIGSDFAFGLKSAVEAVDFSGYEVVKYTIDKGQFYGGVAIQQNKTGKNSTLGAGADGNLFDAQLGARFGDLDVSIIGGRASVDSGSSKDTVSVAALEAAYTIDAIKLEATYITTNGADDEKRNTIGAAASYTADAWTFAGGLSNADAKVKGDDKVTNGFVNAAYALHANVTSYAEVGYESGDDKDLGFAVGVKASF